MRVTATQEFWSMLLEERIAWHAFMPCSVQPQDTLFMHVCATCKPLCTDRDACKNSTECMHWAGTWRLRPGSGGVARQARQQRGSQSGRRRVQQALHGLQACAHLPHKDATWSEHHNAGRQPAP